MLTVQLTTVQKRKSLLSSGFTLIELLVSIAILGILATAVLVALNPTVKIAQAKDSKVKSDLGQIITALTAYYTTSGTTGTPTYPPVATALTPLTSPLITSGELQSIPTPPDNTITYQYLVTTSGTGNTAAKLYSQLYDPTGVSGGNHNWFCWNSTSGVASVYTNTVATATVNACP